MSMRTIWVLVICVAIVAVAVVLMTSGESELQVTVDMTPRDDDGSQLGLDFTRDLVYHQYESAYERTSTVFQQGTDYGTFAQQARDNLSGARNVLIQEGGAQTIVARVEFLLPPARTVTVRVVTQGGFWVVAKVEYN